MQRDPRVVAEGEQHLVADVGESARAVRAYDDAREVVAQVERDRDERADLRVRRVVGPGLGRLVVAHDLVALEHAPREALGQLAALRVVLEAVGGDEIEVAVAVVVAAREQEPLLGLHQLDRREKDELGHRAALLLVAVSERPALGVEPMHLPAQLTVPLALRAQRLLEAAEEHALVVDLLAQPIRLARAIPRARRLLALRGELGGRAVQERVGMPPPGERKPRRHRGEDEGDDRRGPEADPGHEQHGQRETREPQYPRGDVPGQSLTRSHADAPPARPWSTWVPAAAPSLP
jgi:hypothetical protein